MGAHRSNEARKLYDPEANFVEESSREKVVNRWSIMGIGSAVIATTIIVVAMSSSTTPKIMHGQTASSAVSPSSSPKTSRSTSYRKNPMRSDYKLLNEDEKSALFKKFQVERAKKVIFTLDCVRFRCHFNFLLRSTRPNMKKIYDSLILRPSLLMSMLAMQQSYKLEVPRFTVSRNLPTSVQKK